MINMYGCTCGLMFCFYALGNLGGVRPTVTYL